MTAAPRAAGVRLPYRQVPVAVRDWVEASLGAAVVDASSEHGGMSPGCAARLRLDDGQRAFVKAVGPELNEHTPELFRHEAAVLRQLPVVAYRPRTLAVYDDGAWVALLLEDVAGRHADLTDHRESDAVWRTVSAQAVELTPAPVGVGAPPLAGNAARWTESWDQLATTGGLPDWAHRRWPELRSRVATLGERLPTESLCHWDIRNDNVLVRADGSVVIVDWGMSRLGPHWADLLALALEWVDEPVFDDRMATTAADPDTVTDMLLGLGGHLTVRATVSTPGLPTMAAFRRLAAERCLAGAARRLGGPTAAAVGRAQR